MPPESVAPELIALQEAVVGRFSVVRELGRGGMGIVFLARDVALDRPVAIKMLPPEFAASKQHRDRFLREARTAARLSHPHIVPIHSVEEHGAIVFFVMSYVDGETLGARVQRSGPLPNREAMRITREVAWALAHAHANGVVHRDVKPENVLLEGVSGRALVTDFGIAQGVDDPHSTGQGRVAGTPRYMSPEQGAGDEVDGRSDVYSLGGVAFYMVTGRSPFDGGSAAAMLMKHMNEPVPSVRDSNAGVPVEFAAAIERCLAKNPLDRFATCDELARVLEPSTDRVAAPVAAFVRDMEVAGGEIGLALSGFLASSFMTALSLRETDNPTFGNAISLTIALVLFTGAAATTGGLLVVRLAHVVDRVRSLIRNGYRHAAIRPAIATMQADEPGPRAVNRIWLMVRIAGALAGMALARSGSGWWPLLGAAAAVAIPTAVFRQSWNELRMWPRALAGRFGRVLFKVAGVGLDASAIKPAMGEPTAVAIGHAAGDLFRALPESVQAEYIQLPEIIERLEADALANRSSPEAGAPARFAAAVSALESLRLDLLRLHAGVPLRGDLTMNLEAARRVGAEIDARLAAEQEVDQALRD